MCMSISYIDTRWLYVVVLVISYKYFIVDIVGLDPQKTSSNLA